MNDALTAKIAAAIRRSGAAGRPDPGTDGGADEPCITFRDYMESCLYDRDFGYYRTGRVRIGRNGDFYTSSAVGTVMGEMLARYFLRLAGEFGGETDAAEWGAGTGRLSLHMLSTWANAGYPGLSSMTYTVVDGNPVHLEEAERTIRSAALKEKPGSLRFLSEAEAAEADWRGKPVVVLANELLDAFPVHRVVRKNGRLWELGVAVNETAEAGAEADDRPFRYVRMPLSDPRISKALQSDGIRLAEDQIAEVHLDAEAWIARMAETIRQGVLVLVDYGHEAAELAAPHRMRGTLLCYRNHLAADDPLRFPGEQDITAHVNFTACRRAAEAAGWQVGYYGTQKRFLIEQGVLNGLSEHDGRDPFGEAARRNRSIRQLLLSDGMSETFKVMTLIKR
ncbi:class I SAM-dependent methyltransferase [Paenibacillus humicola]|uniref:class I SAM-dependent methyltransferase n=1 Tax=Paenibacillus humicola TaxID=3110540 RepID=UPI00237C2EE3|nr:SAM-dependent methyltransferase [Paenibacillus humicola]